MVMEFVAEQQYRNGRSKAPRKRMDNAAPQQRQQPRPSVCRRLFVDDPEDLPSVQERENELNKIYEEIDRDMDAACLKYNFDFRTEEPLEGDWVWERVGHPASAGAALNPSQKPAPPQDPPRAEDPHQVP